MVKRMYTSLVSTPLKISKNSEIFVSRRMSACFHIGVDDELWPVRVAIETKFNETLSKVN